LRNDDDRFAVGPLIS